MSKTIDFKYPEQSTRLFVDKDKEITSEQFQKDIATFVPFFAGQNSNAIVLYIPDNTYLFYTCLMAALHTHREIILPAYLTKELAENLKETTSIIVTNQNLSIPDMEIKTPQATGTTLPLPPLTDTNLIFFTSGSTGTPKKIKKNLSSLLAEVKMHSTYQTIVIQQNPTMIATILPYHMYGMLWRFLLPLANGLTQDLETVLSPEEIQFKQQQNTAILLATTPTFMDELNAYRAQYQFIGNCLAIYSSGSLLPTTTAKNMQNIFGICPYEIFGSTETGGVAWRQQSRGQNWHLFDPVEISQDAAQHLLVDSPFTERPHYQMADAVQLLPQRQFILLGRTDRLVKIAEKRISLPEMEEKLSQHPLIQKAHVLVLPNDKRTQLGAVICLSVTGKQTLIEKGKKFLTDILKTYLKNWYEPITLPRKIRFVHRIPTNAQGKLLQNEISALFQTQLTEPVINNLIRTSDTLTAQLVFTPDAPYFQGHFPEFPILPGVIQLHFVFYFLDQYFQIAPLNYKIQKLKFSNLILPKTTITLNINLAPSQAKFTYTNGDKIYSSGIIKWGDPCSTP